MSGKSLIIATATLAVLGGVVYWANKQKPPEDSKSDSPKPVKLLDMPEASITKITIARREGETTTLAHQGDTWSITEPQPYAVDKEAVLGVTAAVSPLNSDKLIEEKPGDLAQFGLAPPVAEFTFTLKDGKTRKLLLGEDAPVGGGTFVKVDGDAKVYTIAGFTKTALDKKAADLRDKRIMNFDQAKVSKFELGPIEFNRNAQNEWAIVKPKVVRADNFQVEEILRRMKEAKLDATLSEDQKKDLAKQFASATPVVIAKVTDAGGMQTLEIRKTKDDKYYAKSSAVEGFHLLEADAGKGFDKKLDDLRNKKVFDFGFGEVLKLEFKDAGHQVSLNKAGDQWLSGAKKMDSIGIQSLIDKLRDLSSTKFLDTGFTTPAIEISVTSKTMEKVFIAKAGDKYVARREGEPSLYELDAKAVDDLQRAANDIKEQVPPPKSPANAPKK